MSFSHSVARVSPIVPHAPLWFKIVGSSWPSIIWSNAVFDQMIEAYHAIASWGCIMAQMNPTNSLAIAVIATGRSLPFRVKAQ